MRTPPVIDAFGANGFRIDLLRFEGSVLIVDDKVHAWRPRALAEVTPEDLAAVLSAGGAVEFMLLGAGVRLSPPPRGVRETLSGAGLGLELMSTSEACRHYNILSRDGRRLAAGLIAVP